MRRFKQPMTKYMLVLLSLTLIIYVISYYVQASCTWLSNVLISIACGFLTGAVLYGLANKRNSTYSKQKGELDVLSRLKYDAHELCGDAKYFREYHSLYAEEIDCDQFTRRSIEKAYNICEAILSLPEEVFAELGIDEEEIGLLCMDSTEDFYRSIEDIDEDEGLEKLDDVLLQIANKMAEIESRLRKAISEKKKLVDSMDKYSF